MTKILVNAAKRTVATQRWLFDDNRSSIRSSHRIWIHRLLRMSTQPMRLWYRFRRGRFGTHIRLQLGSGRTRLDGWVNMDINPLASPDLWMDLRDPWPLAANSVDLLYSRHCLEHFSESELLDILAKSFHVLNPGGQLRLGVPSLEIAVRQYLAGDFHFVSWASEWQSSGRQFWQYITDRGNHGVALDYDYVSELLSSVGFVQIMRSPGGTSRRFEGLLPPEDHVDDWPTLYVECVKPGHSGYESDG